MSSDSTIIEGPVAQPQAESLEERPANSPVAAVIEQMIVTFGVYVLSIGPMYWVWFDAKYVGGSYLVAAFYEPLWHLAGLIPPFGDAINWYVNFWV